MAKEKKQLTPTERLKQLKTKKRALFLGEIGCSVAPLGILSALNFNEYFIQTEAWRTSVSFAMLVSGTLVTVAIISKDKLFFEIDSEIIRRKIEPELQKSNRALVLGSDWEKAYTKASGNLFQYFSAPINQQLIISKSYVGYQGGLRLLEDIYNTLYEGKTITNQTYQAKLA